MNRTLLISIIGLAAGTALAAGGIRQLMEKMNDGTVKESPTGYTDTPMLPDGKWRVHDDARPRPDVVTPGAEPGAPPSDAVVLFDGKNLDQFVGKDGQPAPWKVENGYVEIVGKSGDITSKEKFSDCQLHVEFMAPNPPTGNSQHRGNSGIFLMERYEFQVLDCYENKTYADGMTGGIYGQQPPLKNACRKPGEWQSYDIVFTAPKFEGGKVVSPARVTILLNGVLMQLNTELLGTTAHKAVASYSEHPDKLPLRIQDHGDAVRFRNIWVRNL